jgi:hypothetical protein
MMGDASIFFLPGITHDTQESVYAEFAKACNCPVPSPEERVYAIAFVHNGAQWSATVGEPLSGSAVRSRGKKNEFTEKLHDSARVVAIFAGDVRAYPAAPYVVVTDGGASVGQPSKWENPFYAGRPTSVAYFSL